MGAGKGRTSKIFIQHFNAFAPYLEDNVGYHFGDLGKAEHLYQMSSSGRSTGHFGTGTYFVGEGDDFSFMQTPKSNYSNRPLYEVNFSGYNLFKPKDWKHAEQLHEFLKAVNYFSSGFNRPKSNTPFKVYKRGKDVLGVKAVGSKEDFYAKLKEYKAYTKKHKEEDIDNSLRKLPRFESASTKYMKSLGYEGVDVRHIHSFNNTMYGSVIYDLKELKTRSKLLKEGEPRK